MNLYSFFIFIVFSQIFRYYPFENFDYIFLIIISIVFTLRKYSQKFIIKRSSFLILITLIGFITAYLFAVINYPISVWLNQFLAILSGIIIFFIILLSSKSTTNFNNGPPRFLLNILYFSIILISLALIFTDFSPFENLNDAAFYDLKMNFLRNSPLENWYNFHPPTAEASVYNFLLSAIVISLIFNRKKSFKKIHLYDYLYLIPLLFISVATSSNIGIITTFILFLTMLTYTRFTLNTIRFHYFLSIILLISNLLVITGLTSFLITPISNLCSSLQFDYSICIGQEIRLRIWDSTSSNLSLIPQPGLKFTAASSYQLGSLHNTFLSLSAEFGRIAGFILLTVMINKNTLNFKRIFSNYRNRININNDLSILLIKNIFIILITTQSVEATSFFFPTLVILFSQEIISFKKI